MIRQIALVAVSISFAACASSGPEAPAEETMAADPVASESTSPEPEEGLQALDAGVEQTAGSAEPPDKSDEIVCRRETVTGSRFSQKVCRSVAEIEARSDADQATMRQIQRIKSGGDSSLNGG